MKALFFMLSITASFFAQAQTYIPFPTTYGKWVYDFYDETYSYDRNYIRYSRLYELQTDVTISSTVYKKLYINSVYAGALREEDKRIYFYPDTASREYVLYDFNLQVGDVFTVFTEDYGSKTTKLGSIDFISASDGLHKQFHFGNNEFDPTNKYGYGITTWIEGIGSIYGLLSTYQPFCGQWICQDELKCMTSDETFQYPSNEQACVVTSNQEQIASENILVFPNPSSNTFSIDFKNQTFVELQVTDILGKIIYSKNITQQANCEIPALKTGTYTISLTDATNRILHQKIISTH